MNNLHLIMPMGGAGIRFFENGFVIPKPLIEINGKPFFYWATQSIAKFIKDIDITFVVLEEHIKKFSIDKEIHKYYPKAIIRIIPYVLSGAVCTCMEGIAGINDSSPVIFNDCDHMFYCNKFYKILNDYNLNYLGDAAVLTFLSDKPQFSYVEYDIDGKVHSTIEKQVVSEHAICGAYYFSNASIFKESASVYMNNCQYKEYFISGVYNVLCNDGKTVMDFLTDYHESFGTPEEYEIAQLQGKFDKFI